MDSGNLIKRLYRETGTTKQYYSLKRRGKDVLYQQEGEFIPSPERRTISLVLVWRKYAAVSAAAPERLSTYRFCKSVLQNNARLLDLRVNRPPTFKDPILYHDLKPPTQSQAVVYSNYLESWRKPSISN